MPSFHAWISTLTGELITTSGKLMFNHGKFTFLVVTSPYFYIFLMVRTTFLVVIHLWCPQPGARTARGVHHSGKLPPRPQGWPWMVSSDGGHEPKTDPNKIGSSLQFSELFSEIFQNWRVSGDLQDGLTRVSHLRVPYKSLQSYFSSTSSAIIAFVSNQCNVDHAFPASAATDLPF